MGSRGNKSKKKIATLISQKKLERAGSLLADSLRATPNDYYLHYLSGLLYTEQFRYGDALSSFRRAVRLQGDHAHSYFQIGLIHARLCRFHQAMRALVKAQTLEPGLPQLHDYLREIGQHSSAEEPRLSVCLIVKNEEKSIARCLRSIRAIADEIVVVDTGSDDTTIDIAKQFGATIFPYEWHADFSAAKNFCLGKASGDWILQIDADEELFPEDQNKVREVIFQNRCDGAFLQFLNKTSGEFGENQPILHHLIRLFKNREEIYFENPIHETLQVSGKTISTDIRLLHHGYNLDAATLEKKTKRNAEILYHALQENPRNTDTLFYLSMLHLGNKEFSLCENYALQIVDILNPLHKASQHIYLMALKNLALVNLERSHYRVAMDYCEKALQLNDNYLEPLFYLGLSYFRQQKFSEAKACFIAFLKKNDEIEQRPVFNLFAQSQGVFAYQVHHLLGKIFKSEKNYDLAEKMFLKTVKLNPLFWVGFLDLGYLSIRQENPTQAIDYLDRGIDLAKGHSDVTPQNPTAWSDFTNAVKAHTLLKRKAAEKTAPACSS